VVLFDQRSLSLKDNNSHLGLLVLSGNILLGLLGRDNRTSWDDCAHLTSNGLDSKREWCDIDEKEIFCLVSSLAAKNTALDCSTICHGLIRIDTLVWLFSIEIILQK
jgi:hypothetical protein